jgi:hypothetical protein
VFNKGQQWKSFRCQRYCILYYEQTGVLNAKSCSGQVYIYWPKVVDAVNYDVFMEMNGQMVRQGQTTDTFYTVKGLNNINSYYFSINAYDSSGSRSQRMNAVCLARFEYIASENNVFIIR